MRWGLSLFAAALAACVPYPGGGPDEPPPPQTRPGSFPDLDGGAAEIETQHFKISAYGSDAAKSAGETVEKAFNRITIDYGLMAFSPKSVYRLVVYATPEEYHKKTGQGFWSAGVWAGEAVYTYATNPRLAGTIAHELSHRLFDEYMGRDNLDHHWVREGLAVYEECQAQGQTTESLFASVRSTMARLPMTLDQVIHLTPATEKEYPVNLWYAQSTDMIKYMMEHGGGVGFSQFLAALSQGRALDDATGSAFPGHWKTLADFYQEWQRSLQ